MSENNDASVFNPEEHSHLRYNPLLGEFVLVSPHRLKRPWQGSIDAPTKEDLAENDPKNPLCPGATRSNGLVNPDYEKTFIFENDFPALLKTVPSENGSSSNELLQCHPAEGTCRVMCFHPSTNMTIPEMDDSFVLNIVQEWIKQLEELGNNYTWVQIFENKGAIMGCSNLHPHCQIWASSFLPNMASTEDQTQKTYFAKHGRPLLVDYVQLELKQKSRIVIDNKYWVALVPFWAQWPYETMLLPKRHVQRLSNLTAHEQSDLADIMKKLLTKYDNLFEIAFPYSMGWHGAPTGRFLKEDTEHWQLHAEYYPPLLRSHSIKKHMVGYEMLAIPQRDLTAEKAAETLRNVLDTHYRLKKKVEN